ncbi:MAG: RnfABCDGE type electron transport complex subunit G [Halanaerobiales bacterium]
MNKSISRLVITLTVIGVVSAFILTFVYEWTTPHIERHQAEAREEAIYEVLPEADSYKEIEKNGTTFYEGYDNSDSRIGVAMLTSGSGFQGEIELMIGVDLKAEEIYGIKILEHEETPGLGAKITEDDYKNNFKNKPFGDYEVIKREAEKPDEVEAIAGATISSEKVTEIVEEAVADIESVYGGAN